MGCTGSIPKAETFLANEQPAPPNGCLHEGMPTEGLTMQAWSNFDPGNHYHQPGGVLGALTTVSVALEEHGDDSASYSGSTLSDVVGNEGVGKPETLNITAGGQAIATMSMPRHMSFGTPCVLRDAAGNVIAVIATAQTTRPQSMSTSSVNVWGIKAIAGQAPTNVAGIDGYLWARAERRAFSNAFTIYDASNQHFATGAPIRGWAWQYKFTAPNGDGLMIASFTAGSKKKSFDINVAKGVDVSLAICMMAAMQAGHDELQVDPSSGGDSGGYDD